MSLEPDHTRVIAVVETVVAVRLVGTEGAVVSAVADGVDAGCAGTADVAGTAGVAGTPKVAGTAGVAGVAGMACG